MSYMFLGHLSGDISAYVMKEKNSPMTRHALEVIVLRMVIRYGNIAMFSCLFVELNVRCSLAFNVLPCCDNAASVY